MTTTCETVRDLLVDYVDDELEVATKSVVRDHIGVCSTCHGELQRLQRSLDHARQIWDDSAAMAPVIDARDLRLRKSLAIGQSLSWAAAVAAIVAGSWLFTSRLPDDRDSSPNQIARREDPTATQEPDPDISDLRLLIAEEAQSARLAASRRLLAERPALADYSRHADVYLATTYEDSSAGAQARQRLDGPAASDTGALP